MTPKYDPDNIFAKILRGEMPCVKVYEDDVSLAFMDVMPRADGHTLVIPKAPARTLFDIDPEELARFMPAVQKVGRAVMAGMEAEGLLLQQFNEPASGQQVFHLHFHLLPVLDGRRAPPARRSVPERRGAQASRGQDRRGAGSGVSERGPPAGAASIRTPTPLTHMHYFPLGVGVATLFFALLLGLLFFIQLRLLGHAYSALGLDPRVATLVLFGSLLGSYVNLPLVAPPG